MHLRDPKALSTGKEMNYMLLMIVSFMIVMIIVMVIAMELGSEKEM